MATIPQEPKRGLLLAILAIFFALVFGGLIWAMMVDRATTESEPATPSPGPSAEATVPADKVGESTGELTGTVTNVLYRPNQVEDGFYALEVTAEDGSVQFINATGYLNTPLLPEDNGEACVAMPTAEEVEGAEVRYRLPQGTGADGGRAVTCYPLSSSEDFFFEIVAD